MPAEAAAVPLTELLQAWRAGDGRALSAVIESAHDELRRMAAARLRSAGGPITITVRDVLHEAVARLMAHPSGMDNRAHFFATMSLAMRAIVVDHARARMAEKRGGSDARVTLTHSLQDESDDIVDVIALDQLLHQVGESDPRGSAILHLSYFAGMSQSEIAQVLKVSTRTVERDLKFLRAWLQDALGRG